MSGTQGRPGMGQKGGLLTQERAGNCSALGKRGHGQVKDPSHSHLRGFGCPDLTPAPSPPPAYFSLQVISARRAFRVSPPLTTGPPEFERVYRAQVNCSEYFPLFLATLWVAGIFFHEGAAALCGLVYLFARLRYFQGYARSAQLRLAPLYASARALWLLVALAALGLLAHFLPAALRAALLGRLRTLLPWA
uniref:Leukotriene C4 synthase n=1 Tax=Macaca fascicularis TaxID=9541 RepID=A0A2K5VDB3_MACFA